jgi:hypothetical protein
VERVVRLFVKNSVGKNHRADAEINVGNPAARRGKKSRRARSQNETAAADATAVSVTTRNQRSELGRQIAVDLEADADFDECRGCPGHGFSPLRARPPFR